MADSGNYVLTITCPDVAGIVHAVTGFLVEHGGNISESQQYWERLSDTFFMRVEFTVENRRPDLDAAALRTAFEPLAAQHQMTFELWDSKAPYRTLIMVSKHLHCLNDLLFRWSTGALPIDIPVVVSNHPDAEKLVRSYGLEFEHIPVSADTKPQAEQRLRELITEHDVHLTVLARYMQVLSDEFCRDLAGQVINIHHSFLPSFKGAKPYHQAFDRGVKLVGATAHYVTGDLDEGPIIEQDVLRVDHGDSQDELVAIGRDVEARVLSRAVKWHAESRVLLNGHRTVVFS